DRRAPDAARSGEPEGPPRRGRDQRRVPPPVLARLRRRLQRGGHRARSLGERCRGHAHDRARPLRRAVPRLVHGGAPGQRRRRPRDRERAPARRPRPATVTDVMAGAALRHLRRARRHVHRCHVLGDPRHRVGHRRLRGDLAWSRRRPARPGGRCAGRARHGPVGAPVGDRSRRRRHRPVRRGVDRRDHGDRRGGARQRRARADRRGREPRHPLRRAVARGVLLPAVPRLRSRHQRGGRHPLRGERRPERSLRRLGPGLRGGLVDARRPLVPPPRPL
ncbi:MAG: hypothetical protein AVDCRST_MAG50-1738, partial [uncultured Acidimicrobiales bacterium]